MRLATSAVFTSGERVDVVVVGAVLSGSGSSTAEQVGRQEGGIVVGKKALEAGRGGLRTPAEPEPVPEALLGT